MNLSIIGRILIIIVVLLGILNQPYSYYEFLRIFVFLISVILTIHAFQRENKTGFEYLYLVLAILYNPIAPIYTTREVWLLFNILTVISVGISLSIDKGTSKS